MHALVDVYALDSVFLETYRGLRSSYTVRVWHSPKPTHERGGAITALETPRLSGTTILDLLPRLPAGGVDVLQAFSDAHALVVRVANDALHEPASAVVQPVGVGGLAWLLRLEPDVMVEVLIPGAATLGVADPYEQIRAIMVQAGVEPQRVIRGATCEERLGMPADTSAGSIVMILYRR